MNADPSAVLLRKSKTEPYGKSLDMRVLEVSPGYSLVEMKCTEAMLNLFGYMHGGAIFSLIDDAFEMACNSHGTVSVALNTNITFMAPVRAGTTLRAEARELNLTRRTGTYQVEVTDDAGKRVALCQAVSFRMKDQIPFLDEDA